MVQIVNNVTFAFLGVLMLTITLCNCSVLKQDTSYRLIPGQNEVKGTDENATTLEVKSRYLHSIIAYLYNDITFDEAHLKGYNWMKHPIFEGYKISGCLDTVKAKLMLGNHFLKKYNIIRKDTIYLDTIYKIKIIDRSKLPISKDDCTNSTIAMKLDSTEIYSSRTCIEWNSFFINIVDSLCERHHCKPLRIPEGDDRLDIITPVKKELSHDVSGMIKYYEETFGIRVTQERVDSVQLVLYMSALE